MLFTDTTLLDSYNNNVLSWKLKTAYLERWADKEIVFVRPIFVDIYDSLGERAAFLRADSGRFDMKFTYVNAYGHVYALTPKGASVRADSLIWNKRDNLVRTESYVRVVSEDGDVLQGKGFESDAKMDNWMILADVTGIFQDAANRLKEEDKKQAAEHALPDSAAQAQPAQNSAQPVTQNATQPSQTIGGHHVCLVFDGACLQKRIPMFGASCRPIGHIHQNVVTEPTISIRVATPQRKAKVVAHLRANTPPLIFKNNGLLSPFKEDWLRTFHKKVSFVVLLHLAIGFHQQQAIVPPVVFPHCHATHHGGPVCPCRILHPLLHAITARHRGKIVENETRGKHFGKHYQVGITCLFQKIL